MQLHYTPAELERERSKLKGKKVPSINTLSKESLNVNNGFLKVIIGSNLVVIK